MYVIAPFKKRLLENVAEMIEARKIFISVANKLCSLGENGLGPRHLSNLPDAFTKLLSKQFSEREEELTEEYSNGLPVKIITDEQYYRFVNNPYSDDQRYLSHVMSKNLIDLEDQSPHEQVLALEKLIHNMPWIEIKKHIDYQCMNTKSAGMKMCTSNVLDFFVLKKRYNRAILKKGSLVASRDYSGESWDTGGYIRSINEVQQSLGPLAEETSLDLGDGLQTLINALKDSHQTKQPIPMRSQFGKGSHIDVRVFKTKVTYTISPTLVDAIMASTVMYCDNYEIDALMSIMDESTF